MRIPYVFLVFVFAVSLFAGCQHMTGKTAGQTIDDSGITAEIRGKLIKTPGVRSMAVNVDTFRGQVTLSGAVPNREVELEVIRLAQTTAGVKSVKNNLHIEPQMTKPILEK